MQSFRDVRAWALGDELHDLFTHGARPRRGKARVRVLVSKYVQSRRVDHEKAKAVARRVGDATASTPMRCGRRVALFERALKKVAKRRPPPRDRSATLLDPLVDLARAGVCPFCRRPRFPCAGCGRALVRSRFVEYAP